jgi:hypothetical protein
VARKSPPAVPVAVFHYEARYEGRPIVVLHGISSGSGGLDVETEAYPVGRATEEALTRTFSFPTQDKARRFVEDVLTALEYQNCVVNEEH